MNLFSQLAAEPTHEELFPGAVLMRGLALRAGCRVFCGCAAHSCSRAPAPCDDSQWFADVCDGVGLRHSGGISTPLGSAEPKRAADVAADAADADRFCPALCGASGFPRFRPDTCHINRYQAGTKLGIHQDRHEFDLYQPIVSISLGLECIFLLGGFNAPTRRSGSCWSMAM